MRSRSIVVRPGATASFAASSTCRTTRPLRRIFSISEGDLQTIDILNCSERLLHDLFHRLLAIYFNQPPTLAVKINQWQRLRVVDSHTLRKNAFLIVRARYERRAINIADAM